MLFFPLVLSGSQRPAAGAELRSDHASLFARPLSPEALVGETLAYDIAFLWFDRIAEGRLSFAAGERPDTYRAVLEAKTLGVAAWLTSERLQRYESLMEVAPGGRLRPLSFESHIIKGKGEERSDITNRYTFDYQGGRVRHQRARNGEFYKDNTTTMPADFPVNDVLTAFYNFRAGLFGPVRAGSRFVIPTFDRKGPQEIIVELLADADRPKDPFFPAGGLLGQVILDEEVFDTRGGAIYVWFDDLGRPIKGLVENVVGLGHVRGTLRQ